MHIHVSLPTAIENGARRILQWSKEVATTDGGWEVRNSRWSSPLRLYEVGFNNADIDKADHATVEWIWRQTAGGTHSFNLYDEKSDETVRVRFDADLQFTNTVGPFYRIDTFPLREVRGTYPTSLVLPIITGTLQVGQTLSCSTGTWSGTPTIAYQWTRDGADISGETASTYDLVIADDGAMIGCQVFATSSFRTTRADAAEVGPIAP